MCRKFFTGLILVGVGSYLWMGTSVGSYTRTAYGEIVRFVGGQVPIDLQIKRARQLLQDVIPDISRAKRMIAEEEVRLVRLQKDAASVEQNLESERFTLLELKDKVEKGQNSFVVNGRSFSENAVKAELARRFASFKRVDGTLKAKKEVIAAREQGLLAARAKHDQLVELRQQLESELENLEAQHKMVQVKKLSKGMQVDDSRVDELREALGAICENIEVEKKLSEEDGKLFKQIDAEAVPAADLGKQIDQYFQQPTQPAGIKL